MRRLILMLVITIPSIVPTISCKPSEMERQQEEIREEKRVAAWQAVDEERHEKTEREKNEAAVASYHVWFMHTVGEPGPGFRNVKGALEHVALQGETLVIEIGIADKDEAVRLCSLSLSGWQEREEHGVSEVRVVSSEDGSTLATSIQTSTGERVCR